jgi:membrane associated rhomboid family serine protease
MWYFGSHQSTVRIFSKSESFLYKFTDTVSLRLNSTGVVAPVFAGMLLALSQSLPLIASAAIFAATAACSLLLPFEKAPDAARSRRFSVMSTGH